MPLRTAGSAVSSSASATVEGGVDVGEHRLVEVEPAEALEALRRAEHLGAVGGAADHGGVERAAAEVVDGDGLAAP